MTAVIFILLPGHANAQEPSSQNSGVLVDPTATALEQERLRQEIERLRQQNAEGFTSWEGFELWAGNHAAELASAIAASSVGGFAVYRYFTDRELTRHQRSHDEKLRREDLQAERETQSEERFRVIVNGLSDDRIGARIGAAVMLRFFLHPGEEKFYASVFDLAAFHLRQIVDSAESYERDEAARSGLRQALGVVLVESYRLARDAMDLPVIPEISPGAAKYYNPRHKRWEFVETFRRPYDRLDGTLINLRGEFLEGADFQFARLVQANFSDTYLVRAEFGKAAIHDANFRGATLNEANFYESLGTRCSFDRAHLNSTCFDMASLTEATFRESAIILTTFRGTNLDRADFTGSGELRADFSGAILSRAVFSGCDLRVCNLGLAETLDGAKLSNAIVSSSQRDLWGKQGAIVNECIVRNRP